jgi:hypothetical protein
LCPREGELRLAAGALRDALGTRALRRLQAAWAACSLGGWAFFVTLSIYAYDVGGASLAGVAAVVRMAPAALVALDGPPALVFAPAALFTAVGTGHKPAQAALADEPRRLAAANALLAAERLAMR